MKRRELAGLAAAACVACCTGPILAALGSVAALGLVGSVAFGAAALVVSASVIGVVLAARSRMRRRDLVHQQPVALGPTRFGHRGSEG